MVSAETRVFTLDYAELGAIGDHLLAARDAGLRPRTILLRHQRLVAVQDRIGRPLIDAGEEDLRGWWRTLGSRRLANATRATYLSHVRAFYRWALLEHRIDVDPTQRILPPKRPRRLPRDVSPAQVLLALAVMDPRPRMMLSLALWGGLRCAEIAAVHPARDLVTRADGRRVLHVTGKGGAERHVTLPLPLVEELLALAGDGWAFPLRGEPSRHVSPGWVSEHGAQRLRDAGIAATVHQLRHTFATALLAATGGNLPQVAGALGHASVATAEVYARAAALDPALIDQLFVGGVPASAGGVDPAAVA